MIQHKNLHGKYIAYTLWKIKEYQCIDLRVNKSWLMRFRLHHSFSSTGFRFFRLCDAMITVKQALAVATVSTLFVVDSRSPALVVFLDNKRAHKKRGSSSCSIFCRTSANFTRYLLLFQLFPPPKRKHIDERYNGHH